MSLLTHLMSWHVFEVDRAIDYAEWSQSVPCVRVVEGGPRGRPGCPVRLVLTGGLHKPVKRCVRAEDAVPDGEPYTAELGSMPASTHHAIRSQEQSCQANHVPAPNGQDQSANLVYQRTLCIREPCVSENLVYPRTSYPEWPMSDGPCSL